MAVLAIRMNGVNLLVWSAAHAVYWKVKVIICLNAVNYRPKKYFFLLF